MRTPTRLLAFMCIVAAAAALGACRHVYRPGNGVTTPKLLKEVKPLYTAAAMQARIQGAISLDAVVREDGTVSEVHVTKSLDKRHGLDDEAVKAMKQWQFEPGTKDNKPVPVRLEVQMTFALK
jgi:TonB family protein